MAIRSYLAALLVLAAASRGLGSQSRPAELAFALDPQGAVIVPVTIQGLGPFPFMLDTGSTHSVISEDVVRRLGVSAVARSRLQTSTGSATVPIVEIASAEVGGAVAPRLQASVLTKLDLKVAGEDIAGVLGQDFLSARHFTLDYAHRRLTWDDLPGPSERSDESRLIRLPLVEDEGRFVVHTWQQYCGGTLRLVLDSGSSELVLFEHPTLAALDLTPVSDGPQMALTSLTGSQTVRLMRLDRLVLGSLTLRHQLAVVVPPSSSSYSTVDGLLPLHTFSRVSFRPRDGYVLIGR